MLSLLLLLPAAVRAVRLVRAVPCPVIDGPAGDDIRDHPADVTVVLDAGPGRSLFHMELYADARLLAGRLGRTVVVVDCASGRVGLAFASYSPGMDCARAMAAEIMDRVNGVTEQTDRAIKLIHLLSHLDDWHESRACEPWTARWPGLGAAAFWLITAGAAWTARGLVRLARRPPRSA